MQAFTSSHEDARAVIEAASKDEIVLPTYEGDANDLAYLKQYVINSATALYGIQASTFDTPTLFSTSLLRDFVHRAVYHNDSELWYSDLVASSQAPPMEHDVAAALRYPAYELCGLLGWQMFTVFEAFGFDARRISGVEGSVPRSTPQDDVYFSGHVTTEVYLEDIGKFAVQDATFNNIFIDRSGIPLSVMEMRLASYVRGDSFDFDPTSSYVNYQTWGYKSVEELGSTVSSRIEAIQSNDWFNVPYQWISTVGGPWDSIRYYYNPSPSTEQMYTTKDAAVLDLQALRTSGASWESAQAILRATKDITGFKMYSPDTGAVTSAWLTLAIADGSYVSVDMMGGGVLNGTFDQLIAEASGYGTVDRNPAQNLSFVFNPVALIGPSGNIGYDWAAASLSQIQEKINGTSGSDVLTDGAGRQLLQGGLGDDRYYINSHQDMVWEASNAGYDRVYTTTSYAASPNSDIEYLAASIRNGIEPIALTGNRFTEVMAGNYGHNVFFGGPGPQKMFGYLGNDTYYVDTKLDSANEYAGQGHDRIYTTATYALPFSTEIEELAVTAASSDTLVNLYGNTISNTLTGNAGNNLLDGRGGGDTLIGLGGSDSYMINDGGDLVIEAAGEGIDTVFSTISYMLNADAYVETLRVATSVPASTSITLIGNGIVGLIVGHSGNNELNAQGAPGTKLVGGVGNDTYFVHLASDQITEAAGQGFDTVNVSTSYTLGYGVEIERLETAYPDLSYEFHLTGNAFSQAIVGNVGNNVLNGKDGNDVLTGGDGSDTFVFDTALGSNNVDTITDFSSGEDAIQLSTSRFTNIGMGALDSSALAFGATATDADDRILYDSPTGNLFYDKDGLGGIAAVQFATLTPHTSLTAYDFLIV